MLLCRDNSNAHWIMNQVGKCCGSVVSETLVEITSQGTPAKLKVTFYLRFPSMAVTLKIYDVVAVSQWCSQAGSMFRRQYSKAECLCGKHVTAEAIYTYILYASGLVSWHKFSLANIFLHSDQPTTAALAFHLYSHLLHPRLGNILYKQDQNCPNWQKSAQYMWDRRTLKTQTSERWTSEYKCLSRLNHSWINWYYFGKCYVFTDLLVKIVVALQFVEKK